MIFKKKFSPLERRSFQHFIMIQMVHFLNSSSSYIILYFLLCVQLIDSKNSIQKRKGNHQAVFILLCALQSDILHPRFLCFLLLYNCYSPLFFPHQVRRNKKFFHFRFRQKKRIFSFFCYFFVSVITSFFSFIPCDCLYTLFVRSFFFFCSLVFLFIGLNVKQKKNRSPGVTNNKNQDQSMIRLEKKISSSSLVLSSSQ
jgi:hypothetical protein